MSHERCEDIQYTSENMLTFQSSGSYKLSPWDETPYCIWEDIQWCMHACVCVCVSVWEHVCACMSVCACVCACVRMYMCMYACVYVCVCVQEHVCTHMSACVCMYVCVSVCICVCIYVFVYVCIYVCMCVYICVYVCVGGCGVVLEPHTCFRYVRQVLFQELPFSPSVLR